jgi:hypothetical protein
MRCAWRHSNASGLKMGRLDWHGDQLLTLVHQRVLELMHQCGFEIVPLVQAVTPVKTGAAQASVTFDVDEAGQRVTLRYGGTVNYYQWIEIGSRGRPGRAPLGQTFGQAIAIVQQQLDGIV